MTARIYRPARNAMQSGKGKSKSWVLVHELAESKDIDPLMGYTTSGDTRQQVRLTFPNAEAAQAYAAREGVECHVVPAPQPKLKLQTYADNFR